jgi:hypothetical protein
MIKNYFYITKPVDWVNESRGPVAGSPWWTMCGGGRRAHRSAHRVVLRGTKAHHGSTGRERAMARSSPRSKSGGAVARLLRWQRGSEFGGGARCGASGGTQKRNKERHKLWCGAVMRKGSFIASGRRWRGGEGVGRRWIFNSMVSTLNRGEESMRRQASAGE